MAIYNVVGGKQYTLASSIGSTDTSILLSSFQEPVTGTPLTMANMNTSIAYGTIAPKTSSAEFISFTGVTQNANGTATLTGVTRGLAKKYPFTTSVSYKLPHSGTSVFILSDAPQVLAKYAAKDADETITGTWTFSSFPISPGNPYATNAVDGITKLSVAAASPTAPIAVGTNDPRMPSADPTTLFEALSAFGDGSDGDVTISSPTTLTGDKYYNNLTVNDVLSTGGYRIFVKGTLTGTGTIQNNGANGTNASGTTAGTGGAATVGYFTNSAGGNGTNGLAAGNSNGNSGSAATNIDRALLSTSGSAGGKGGDAGVYVGSAGSGCTATGVAQKFGLIRFLTLCGLDVTSTGATLKYTSSCGGTGGGSGAVYNIGTGSSGAGGGAGASGGIVGIFAYTITGTLTFKATGGNGGNGSNYTAGSGTQGGGGGGAGGNGGYIYIVYKNKSGTQTYTVTGGTPGTFGTGNGGNGTAGTAGSTGASKEILISSLI